jgi:hypothetical protein
VAGLLVCVSRLAASQLLIVQVVQQRRDLAPLIRDSGEDHFAIHSH